MSTKLKPFDLEAAKRGEPLVTRDGRAVTEFHHFETENTKRPCVAIINGDAQWFTTCGMLYADGSEPGCDLLMAPRKRTVYVNIWDNGMCRHYPTEAEAREHDGYIPPELATAVPIEIEV